MSGTGESAVLRRLCADDAMNVQLDESEWVTADPATGERQFLIRLLLARLGTCICDTDCTLRDIACFLREWTGRSGSGRFMTIDRSR